MRLFAPSLYSKRKRLQFLQSWCISISNGCLFFKFLSLYFFFCCLCVRDDDDCDSRYAARYSGGIFLSLLFCFIFQFRFWGWIFFIPLVFETVVCTSLFWIIGSPIVAVGRRYFIKEIQRNRNKCCFFWYQFMLKSDCTRRRERMEFRKLFNCYLGLNKYLIKLR